MESSVVSWIVSVIGGSVAGKGAGFALKDKGLGLIGNPLVGIAGGVAAAQGAIALGLFASGNIIANAAVSIIAGGLAVFVASRFKKEKVMFSSID